MGKRDVERAFLISLLATTIMGSSQLIFSFIFNSLALLALGLETLSDSVTTVVAIWGTRVSRRPADRGHPYGHWQAESLVSLFLALALGISGLRVLISSVDRLRAGTVPGITPEAILVPAVSASVCLTLALYKLRVGRREGSLPLVSDAYHTLTDFLTSTSAGLGLAAVHAGYPAADPAVAMAISFLLFYLSFSIGRASVSLLMERAAPEQMISEMKSICRQTPGVRGFHKLRTRRSGSKIFADVHVLVDQDKSVREAHEIASKLERRLKSKIHGLSSVVVHVEPERRPKSSTSRKERS